jgi:hypothetical protein
MKIDRSSWFSFFGGGCYETNCLSLFFWGTPMEVWYLNLRILLCVFYLVQCLNKPYPGVWLEGIVDKNQKPSRTLQTNRQTSPLDPLYILPSGPSIMPSGEKVSTQVLPFPFLLHISDQSKINLLSNLEKFQIVVEFHSANLSPGSNTSSYMCTANARCHLHMKFVTQ